MSEDREKKKFFGGSPELKNSKSLFETCKLITKPKLNI